MALRLDDISLRADPYLYVATTVSTPYAAAGLVQHSEHRGARVAEIIPLPHADDRMAWRYLSQRLSRQAVIASVVRDLQYLGFRQAAILGYPKERWLFSISAQDGVEPATAHV